MDVCFEFGIELEEDVSRLLRASWIITHFEQFIYMALIAHLLLRQTSAKEMAIREVGAHKVDDSVSDRPILKIDIPANR